MKKVITFILLLFLSFVLIGCGVLDIFKPNIYDVEFYIDEDLIKVIQVEENSKIKLEDYPVTTKFQIEGWYLDNTFTTNWNKETSVVESDILLYAKPKVVLSFEGLNNNVIKFNSTFDKHLVYQDDFLILTTQNHEFDLTTTQFVKSSSVIRVDAVDNQNKVLKSIEGNLNYFGSSFNPVIELSFEDVTKGSYQLADIETDEGIVLTMSDALLGATNADLKNQERSIRLRENGFVKIKENIKNMHAVSFITGVYTNDDPGVINVLLIDDLDNVLETISTINVTSELIEHTIEIPKLNNDTVYLMFEHESGNRINIDDIVITKFEDEYFTFDYELKEDYLSYYEGIEGLSGEELVLELRKIISVMEPVSYGDARFMLAISDLDPNDNYQSVRGIYNQTKISTTWIGTGQGAWQREHVWPNSKLGVGRVGNSTKNQGTDLHNLRAIDKINQSRSNRHFVDSSGEGATVGTTQFYPGDIDKGDVARILMYMAIRYDFLKLTNNEEYLGNYENYNVTGAYGGKLEYLLKWHNEDPVDNFELRRNELIYGNESVDNMRLSKPQKNRNPFIDHPSLFESVYYYFVSIDENRQTINYQALLPDFSKIDNRVSYDYQI